jgi:hypothetical protein
MISSCALHAELIILIFFQTPAYVVNACAH